MSLQDSDEIRNKQVVLYREVLKSIIATTRCHSCGYKMPVCLLGYVGRYCNKYCWKDMYYNRFVDCVLEDCEVCPNNTCFSLANSKYHRVWKSVLNNSGHYWPMCTPDIICNNECIKNTPTIIIPNYNA